MTTTENKYSTKIPVGTLKSERSGGGCGQSGIFPHGFVPRDDFVIGSDAGRVKVRDPYALKRFGSRQGHVNLATLEHAGKTHLDVIEGHSLTLMNGNCPRQFHRQLAAIRHIAVAQFDGELFRLDYTFVTAEKSDFRKRGSTAVGFVEPRHDAASAVDQSGVDAHIFGQHDLSADAELDIGRGRRAKRRERFGKSGVGIDGFVTP